MRNKIIVFDFETGNINLDRPLPLQIGAVAIDGQRLQIIPAENGGEFVSYMKPEKHEERLQEYDEKALRVNGVKIDDIAKYPEEGAVWSSFAAWVNNFAIGKTGWDKPSPAGHNIINFDIPIAATLNKKWGINTFWHRRDFFDTQNISRMLFDGCNDGPRRNFVGESSCSMDDLRDFFGIKKNEHHDALQDCRDCANLLIRYLKLFREFTNRVKFKGAMANG